MLLDHAAGVGRRRPGRKVPVPSWSFCYTSEAGIGSQRMLVEMATWRAWPLKQPQLSTRRVQLGGRAAKAWGGLSQLV
jgi:hypothetical protein